MARACDVIQSAGERKRSVNGTSLQPPASSGRFLNHTPHSPSNRQSGIWTARGGDGSRLRKWREALAGADPRLCMCRDRLHVRGRPGARPAP